MADRRKQGWDLHPRRPHAAASAVFAYPHKDGVRRNATVNDAVRLQVSDAKVDLGQDRHRGALCQPLPAARLAKAVDVGGQRRVGAHV